MLKRMYIRFRRFFEAKNFRFLFLLESVLFSRGIKKKKRKGGGGYIKRKKNSLRSGRHGSKTCMADLNIQYLNARLTCSNWNYSHAPLSA